MEQVLAYAAVAAHIAIVVLVLVLLFRAVSGKTPFDAALARLSNYGIALAFIVALTSMVGSLFYSEILGFAPCVLCWYQRIFMYPLVVILGVALWRDRSDVALYSLPLAVIGGVVAAYHVALQWMPAAVPKVIDCALGGVDCTVAYSVYFGYVSIPVMSLTSFVLIGLLLWLSREGVPKPL